MDSNFKAPPGICCVLFPGGSSYAVRIVVKLASIKKRIKAQELAAETDIPYDHITKILLKLKTARIINSARGKTGGVWLAKDPSQLSVNEVLKSTKGDLVLRDCLFDPSFCRFIKTCRIRPFYADLGKYLNTYLDQKMIADLL